MSIGYEYKTNYCLLVFFFFKTKTHFYISWNFKEIIIENKLNVLKMQLIKLDKIQWEVSLCIGLYGCKY